MSISLPAGRVSLAARFAHYLRSGAFLTDLSGGVISGFVSITYGSSYAALLFAGPLEPYLAYGVSVTLITAILGAVLVCLTSSLYFSVAGPDSNTTSVLSVMLASLATQLAEAGRQAGDGNADVLPHVMLALFLTTFLCGIVLYLLGAFRMGRWVRYIPYPVMGGFLAATGWLMTSGALGIVANTPLTREGVARLLAEGPGVKLPVAVALALLYLVCLKRFRHILTLPAVLLASIAAVYGGLWLTGTDLAAARAEGWLFSGLGDIRRFPPAELLHLQHVRWDLLLSHAGEMVATIMVATITILLVATGLEVATDREMDLDRELRGHGLTNLALALSGGYLGILSLGRSLIIVRAGAATRVSGVIVGLLCCLVLFGSPVLIAFLPKIVLGAFLLYLGISLLVEWLVDSWWRFLFWEYVLVLLILVITALFGFTVGVVVGILGSCLDFAFNYSRVDLIRHDLTGVACRSNLERPQEEGALLDTHGDAIRILVFHGFIFFGMANPLLGRISRHLGAAVPPRVLVIDLSEVIGLDTSAAMLFLKARQIADRSGVAMVFAGLTPRLTHVLRNAGALAGLGPGGDGLFADLDKALEWAEDRLIASHGIPDGASLPGLDQWLLSELGDGIAVEYLKTYLRQLYLDAGEYLFRRQPPANTLYLIDSGRISILANEDSGSPRRLLSLSGGTAFGTEDLPSDSLCATSALAELPSVVYGLPADGLERLSLDHPRLAAQFYGVLMRLLARRLRLANDEIAMLRREAVTRGAALHR